MPIITYAGVCVPSPPPLKQFCLKIVTFEFFLDLALNVSVIVLFFQDGTYEVSISSLRSAPSPPRPHRGLPRWYPSLPPSLPTLSVSALAGVGQRCGGVHAVCLPDFLSAAGAATGGGLQRREF